jgi:ABC-type amino acid transport substrate-binding protein
VSNISLNEIKNGGLNWMMSFFFVYLQEAHMAVGPISVTEERQSVVDFTVPYMEDWGTILTKKGNPILDLLHPFRPLPLHTWLMSVAAIVMTSLVFYVIMKANNLYSSWFRWSREGKWRMEECFLTMYGYLMNQGNIQYVLDLQYSSMLLLSFHTPQCNRNVS